MQYKQTNTREAYRPALSSPNDVNEAKQDWTYMKTRCKVRLNMKRLVVKPTKPHKIRITPWPPP